MLAQTTVSTAAARYETFLRRFPDVFTLARASEESVLAAWSGLGYYSRARNLRLAARIVVRQFGGTIPEDEENRQKLPGFGPYITAAVGALAFRQKTLAFDANVRRIASRLFATKTPETAAPNLISSTRPGDSLNALFDLGQTVCRPRHPRCAVCPLSERCGAFRTGKIAFFPSLRSKPVTRTLHLAAAIVEKEGRFLLRRRRATWLSGMWEFPTVEGRNASAARAALTRQFGRSSGRVLGSVRHDIVGRRLEIRLYAVPATEKRDGRWMTPAQIERSAAPTLTKKIARRAADAPLPRDTASPRR